MPTATFRNAKIAYVDMRHSEGGPICRVHMTSDYSEKLMEDMSQLGWTDLPECSHFMKLDGSLIGGDNMASGQMERCRRASSSSTCWNVAAFVLKRVVKKESSFTQLEFVVRSNSPAASGALWDYMKVCGKADGLLKVKYAEQVTVEEESAEEEDGEEEQQTLPGAEAKPAKGARKPGLKRQLQAAAASVED